MNKTKAVIFDLDGTIADTLPLCIAAFKKSIEPLAGRSFSDEEIIATFGPSEEGTIQQLVPDHYAEALADYYHHYEALHAMCPEPFPGIKDLIRMLKLHKVRIAMVTGKGLQSTLITLARYGMSEAFEFLETGSPLGPRKAEGIRLVLEGLGIRAEDAIYLGDAPGDITASREVEVPVFSVAWAGTTNTAELAALNPDRIFTQVHELQAYLADKFK